MIKITKANVKGLRNTRDVGTLSEVCSIPIRKQMLFRSGRIDKISEKRRNRFFYENNIKTVIDLRTDVEIHEGKKINFPESVKYYQIPILSKAFFGITHEKKMSKVLIKESVNKASAVEDDSYLVEMYKDIIFKEDSQEKIKKLFRVIIDNQDGAILYHCTSGKDRTGIITMFILYILGVDEDIIIEDYALSEYFNKKYIKSRRILLSCCFFVRKDFRRLLKQMLGAKDIYIKKTIEEINKRYGSVESYIRDVLKLSTEDIQIIRKKLLHDDVNNFVVND